ncbi:MAG TPA: glutamate--tRNA ligase, partial [Rhizomicrobium sp.]|nr:glutamate--tRNA ligase [Rhizomicrobium sp.]
MTENKKPVLRFAPSPTGFLHIGGARTALFNWLFARHTGGTFLLRIEDTDRERSTPEAVAAILAGLEWLGLNWDGQTVYQFARAGRHREVAQHLLAEGNAYRCFATAAELDEMRAAQKAAGKPMRYDGRWRDRDPSEAPPGAPFVIRLRAPQTGETTVHDVVQGDVRFANDQLDDMVLLRSDGTPTYMLAVVVDDHDMGVTHVIRGDDHLNNAARQLQIIHAMGWPVPIYGHLPLIHGPDGAKLSKRHGALAVEAYRDMGYLPETMRNYLLRLGWSHGDDETISTEQAIAWFNLESIGRSPARLDFKKLDNLNAHYIRQMDDGALAAEVAAMLARETPPRALDPQATARLVAAMPGLKERAKTLVELAQAADFLYTDGPRTLDAQA